MRWLCALQFGYSGFYRAKDDSCQRRESFWVTLILRKLGRWKLRYSWGGGSRVKSLHRGQIIDFLDGVSGRGVSTKLL